METKGFLNDIVDRINKAPEPIIYDHDVDVLQIVMVMSFLTGLLFLTQRLAVNKM
jgi:hypothetical protein